MAAHEQNEVNRQRFEVQDDRRTRGSSLWWFVWLPIIVAITLWIGGWWFGNYGGPWGSNPHVDRPSISDPAVIISI